MSIEKLLQDLGEIERETSHWQDSPDPVSPDEIQDAHHRYLAWMAKAVQVVPPERVDAFRDAYTGGVYPKNEGFFTEPLKPNVFFDPAAPNAFINRWQHPHSERFGESAAIQRSILHEALAQADPASEELGRLGLLFSRLPDSLRLLRAAGLPPVENEAELQRVVHPLLRLLYRDVRREDLVRQFAGCASRVDFLLREEGVVFETKMTRPGLGDRRLGEELLIDWGRYRKHPDCKAIFALIYDPLNLVANVPALEADLPGGTAGVPTRALVVR